MSTTAKPAKSAKSAKSAKPAKRPAAAAAGPRKPAASAEAGARKPVGDPFRIVEASFVAGAALDGTLPAPVRAEIAFAGRSNVGKSSLINCLVERRSLVRTSSTPGCTRQVNLFEARAADGAVFQLVDLPGYGFAQRSKTEREGWRRLIESFLRERSTLAVVVVLVDVRRGLEDDDRDLVEFIQAAEHPSRPQVRVVIAATKLDKLPRSAQAPALAAVRRAAAAPVIGFSSETAEGRAELWRTLRRHTLGEPLPAEAATSSAPAAAS